MGDSRTEDEGGREAAGDEGRNGRAASRSNGNTLHEHCKDSNFTVSGERACRERAKATGRCRGICDGDSERGSTYDPVCSALTNRGGSNQSRDGQLSVQLPQEPR